MVRHGSNCFIKTDIRFVDITSPDFALVAKGSQYPGKCVSKRRFKKCIEGDD